MLCPPCGPKGPLGKKAPAAGEIVSGTVQRMRGRGTVQRKNERKSRMEKKVRGAGDGANKMSPGEDVKKRGGG